MRIKYRKAALADLAGIRAFIRKSNPRAAQRVIGEIRKRVSELPNFPEKFRVGAAAGTRELVIGRYGYIVIYEVEPAHVVILSVFHAAQDKPRG